MARTDSTKALWRVQVRKSRKHKWVNKGLYETRAVAREDAAKFHVWEYDSRRGWLRTDPGTRVVKHIRGEKK